MAVVSALVAEDTRFDGLSIGEVGGLPFAHDDSPAEKVKVGRAAEPSANGTNIVKADASDGISGPSGRAAADRRAGGSGGTTDPTRGAGQMTSGDRTGRGCMHRVHAMQEQGVHVLRAR